MAFSFKKYSNKFLFYIALNIYFYFCLFVYLFIHSGFDQIVGWYIVLVVVLLSQMSSRTTKSFGFLAFVILNFLFWIHGVLTLKVCHSLDLHKSSRKVYRWNIVPLSLFCSTSFLLDVYMKHILFIGPICGAVLLIWQEQTWTILLSEMWRVL